MQLPKHLPFVLLLLAVTAAAAQEIHPERQYHQHSVWLMTGSKWQPGVLKVLEGLGPRGKPICASLKKILAKYDTFDKGRPDLELKQKISDAVTAWEAKHGKAA